MVSWSSFSWRLQAARIIGVTAGLIFLANVSPWSAYGAAAGTPVSLKQVPAPVPSNLGSVVKDQNACVQLGKAFFWDVQAASDGLTS